jgi:hypothetical protein
VSQEVALASEGERASRGSPAAADAVDNKRFFCCRK